MNKTKIDWCDYTWSPVVGCTHGCVYCYARRMAHRFHRDFTPHWEDENYRRDMPEQPSRIFVNSMSDPADWNPDWLGKVLIRIRCNPQHIFMFLTKRSGVYFQYGFPENCWLGATATTETEVNIQISALGLLPRLSFLSIEPILERIDPKWIDPDAIDWLIVGAETGNRKGRVIPKREWIEALRTCGVPVFEKESLRGLMGELIQQYPEVR